MPELADLTPSRVPDTMLRHSKGKPVMVFCMTRKSAAQTANALASTWNQTPGAQKPWRAPSQTIVVNNAELRSMKLSH